MDVFGYINKARETYDKYKGLVDAGASAVKGYLDYKNQKERNELSESAYRDYMLEVASAGQEAQSAVDLNLTPMEVTNIPRSKADVTDFTALAANGGIIGLRNGGDPNAGITALRKKAPGVVKAMGFNMGGGPGIEALRKKAPDVVKRMGFAMGTGLKNSTEIENIDTTIIENPQGEPPRILEENMKMSEIPKDLTMDEAVRVFKLSNDRDPISIEEVIEFFKNRKLSAKGGIIGLRNGGRPGYMMGEGPVRDNTVRIDDAIETEALSNDEESMEMAYNSGTAYSNNEGVHGIERAYRIWQILPDDIQGGYGGFQDFFETSDWHGVKMQKGGIAGLRNGGRPGYMDGMGPVGGMMGEMTDDTDGTVDVKDFITKKDDVEILNRIYSESGDEGVQAYIQENPELKDKYANIYTDYETDTVKVIKNQLYDMKSSDSGIIMLNVTENGIEPIEKKKGGRVKRAGGGVMDLGGMEKDYRFNGGFVPIGEYEKKDDVPARLSKNEFVFTADAVRAAGGGSINKGAQKMYNTMKTLEAQPQAKRMMT